MGVSTTPTVGKNLSRFQSLTLAAISSLWEAGAASSQSPETRSQPSCPSGISMTKGKAVSYTHLTLPTNREV